MRLATTRLDLYPRSLAQSEAIEFGLCRSGQGNRLVLLAPVSSPVVAEFEGKATEYDGFVLLECRLNAQHAAALRKQLPWLQPQLVGLRTSAGMGDRMGIATPGHVRAMRETHGLVYPIFAQQSIREMQRTARSPQQVIDDAMWGCFEEGWQAGYGADADHLKTTQDIDACLAAGYSFFTFDPGQYVNDQVTAANRRQLMRQLEGLPDELQPEASGLLDKTFEVEGIRISLSEEVLLKAMLKYGKALEHVVAMYRHLEQASSNHSFEVEVSMDETESPTTPEEHLYIVSELRRLGVRWVSFAPRFVGRFEKGVDFIGDLRALDASLAIHAAIARHCGPYKLSLHSGSDKFRIYEMFMHHTQGLVHLKTAGTSYLEALRTIASVDESLLKDIYVFARERFKTDRQSYHISAQVEKAPKPGEIRDWPALLDQFDAREILHVTFGSVLTAKSSDHKSLFYDRIFNSLYTHREDYFDNLVKHFKRHLDPFTIRNAA